MGTWSDDLWNLVKLSSPSRQSVWPSLLGDISPSGCQSFWATNQGSTDQHGKCYILRGDTSPHHTLLIAHVSIVPIPKALTADSEHSFIWEPLATFSYIYSYLYVHAITKLSYVTIEGYILQGFSVQALRSDAWIITGSTLTNPVTMGKVLILSLPVTSSVKKDHFGVHFICSCKY